MLWGEGILIVSTAVARRRALFVLAFTLVVGVSRFVTESRAAGAFAIGKCGAYGQAYDYAGEADARASTLERYAAAVGRQIAWELGSSGPGARREEAPGDGRASS